MRPRCQCFSESVVQVPVVGAAGGQSDAAFDLLVPTCTMPLRGNAQWRGSSAAPSPKSKSQSRE